MNDYDDLELQEQLMNQLEEMQLEIEQYQQTVKRQKQNISQLQEEVLKKDSQLSKVLDEAEELERQMESFHHQRQQIQKLLLEKQELASVVQQQKKKIAGQAEQIEKLNGADLILKENQRLETEKQNVLQETENMVLSVKAEYEKKAQELEEQLAQAKKQSQEAQDLKRNLNERATSKAKDMIQSKIQKLENKYRGKTAVYDGFLLGNLLYSVLVTFFTAVRSECFVIDFKAFFSTLWNFITIAISKLAYLGSLVAAWGNKIPQETVAIIAHWFLWITVVIGISVAVIVFLFIGMVKLYEYYIENLADTISLAVLLVSFAVVVFFAEQVKSIIPMNLLLLMIVTHVLYAGIRQCLTGWRAYRGYYW